MAHIISRESPFRRMPVDLPRRQILYFDALRLSAEMAGLAFERLRDLLTLVSEKKEEPAAHKAVSALLDAYSIIDSLHRFRELLQVTPGLKHNPAFKLFIRQTKDVEGLRHIVQHLKGKVDRIAKERGAALGTLAWLGPSAVPDGPPSCYILQAGTWYPHQRTHGPMIDFQSSLGTGEIADISLTTVGYRVNLSTMMDRLESIIRGLESPLEEFAADKERFGSDVFCRIALEPVEDRAENREPNGT